MHLLLRVPWCIWRHAAAVAIHVCRLPGPMVLPRLPVLMVLQAPMVFSLHESVQSARAAPPRVCNGCCGVRGAKARRWRGSRQRLLRSSAEIALRGPGHRDESQVIRAVRPLTVCKAPRRKIRELRGLRVSAAGCSHRTMNRPLATREKQLIQGRVASALTTACISTCASTRFRHRSERRHGHSMHVGRAGHLGDLFLEQGHERAATTGRKRPARRMGSV